MKETTKPADRPEDQGPEITSPAVLEAVQTLCEWAMASPASRSLILTACDAESNQTTVSRVGNDARYLGFAFALLEPQASLDFAEGIKMLRGLEP